MTTPARMPVANSDVRVGSVFADPILPHEDTTTRNSGKTKPWNEIRFRR